MKLAALPVQSRRLAAILVADVVGFTERMDGDETGTLECVHRYWQDVTRPLIGGRNGIIFKNTGDGFLAEFSSVVEALRCAIDVQEKTHARNLTLPEADQVLLRIGLHHDDIVEHEGDLYGSGVNIAARICPHASPGGICITQSVLDATRGRVSVRTDDLGTPELKGIGIPIRLHGIRCVVEPPRSQTIAPRSINTAVPIAASAAPEVTSALPGHLRPEAKALPPNPPWADTVAQDHYGTFVTIAVPARRGPPVTQRLRWIPPGRFMMGSPADEPGRYDDEGPVHAVTIGAGFWLFDTQCTQALWQAVMGQNPSRFKSATRPVEQVSFADVTEFLNMLNDRVKGLDLSLPTEAQWEYAARAGTATATFAGAMEIVGAHNAPVLDAIAWYGGNSGEGFELNNGYDSSDWPEKQYGHKQAGTHPVGGKAANPWGIYDMLGNVWEWCADEWHDSYGGAPTDGSAWGGGGEGAAFRVMRGGSWDREARNVRAACRGEGDPARRDGLLGFRCARV